MNGLVVLLIALVVLAIQVATWRTSDDDDADAAPEPDPDVDATEAVARHIGALNYGTPEHARAARRQLLAIGPSVVDALLDWLHALERRPGAITAHTRLRFEDLLVDFGLAGLLRIRPALPRFGERHPAWPGLLRVLARLERGAVEQLVRDDESIRGRTLDRIVVTLDDRSVVALLTARDTWASPLAARLDEAILPVAARRFERLDPAALSPLGARLLVEFGVGTVDAETPLTAVLAARREVPSERLRDAAALARRALDVDAPCPPDVDPDAFDLGSGAAREALRSRASAGLDDRWAGLALVRLALVDADAADEVLADRVRTGTTDGPDGWCALAATVVPEARRSSWLADVLRNGRGDAWTSAVALCHDEPWDALLVPALEAVARRGQTGGAAPLVRLLVGRYDVIGGRVRAALANERAEVRAGARVVVAWARDAQAPEHVVAGLDLGDDPVIIAQTLEHIGAPAARSLHDLSEPLAPALARVRDLCTALAERGDGRTATHGPAAS